MERPEFLQNGGLKKLVYGIIGFILSVGGWVAQDWIKRVNNHIETATHGYERLATTESQVLANKEAMTDERASRLAADEELKRRLERLEDWRQRQGR